MSSAAFAVPRPALPSLPAAPRPPLLSGVPAFDQMGGVPRASLTELWGEPSSGRSSLLLSLLRTNTVAGEYCAWVDGPNAFDPLSASEAGVRLPHLLWVLCGGNGEHALQAADLLVHGGGFAVVVLDLSGVAAAVTRRISPASWYRLRRGAEHSGSALLVTGEQPMTGSCAPCQLRAQQMRVATSGQRFTGMSVRVEGARGRYGQAATFETATLR